MTNELKTNITEINRLTCSLDELKNQICIAKQSENSLIEQCENLCKESSAENNHADFAIIQLEKTIESQSIIIQHLHFYFNDVSNQLVNNLIEQPQTIDSSHDFRKK